MNAIAHVDGGNRGQPGPHACAVVLTFPSGEKISDAVYLGPSGSNNQAEYEGVILALNMALKEGVTDIIIRSDSKLVVEQLLGNWKIKQPHLRDLHATATDLARRFRSVQIDHVRREKNKDADALCTALLDQVTGKARGS